MKTYSVKATEIERGWHVIDAADKVLGKVATEAAALLMGKHKPMFTKNMDTGDYVIIVNAEKVHVSGKKEDQKNYYWHSDYPGGFKSRTLGEMRDKKPTFIIEHAVKGMLPKTRLGNAMIKKLKVYTGSEHPHIAQIKKEEAQADS